MGKPSIGGFYTLSDGTKGRIMKVELQENGYYLGHTSFSEWFKRFDSYRITVSYETPSGNIRSEDFTVKK